MKYVPTIVLSAHQINIKIYHNCERYTETKTLQRISCVGNDLTIKSFQTQKLTQSVRLAGIESLVRAL